MEIHPTIAALGVRESDCVVGPPLDLTARVRILTADSREVAPGAMFGAFQGLRAHGADYLGAAATRGAIAALASPSGVLRALEALGSLPIPVLVDPVPRQRFAAISSRFWPEAPATRVAVTGTNGKTSTVDFLRQIWRICGLLDCGIGTLGAFGPKGGETPGLTTPEPTVLHRLLSNSRATEQRTLPWRHPRTLSRNSAWTASALLSPRWRASRVTTLTIMATWRSTRRQSFDYSRSC